jgi:hypothetical protein
METAGGQPGDQDEDDEGSDHGHSLDERAGSGNWKQRHSLPETA